MKARRIKPVSEKTQENARAAAVRRILNIAQLVRQRGTPDEADEAVEWEKKLQGRLQEIEITEAA